MIDNLSVVSMALNSKPNSYCLLLGSGVSSASGIPTGWQVIQLLIKDLMIVQNEESNDPELWFQNKYGVEPNYNDLLRELGPTPSARQQLLLKYFESGEEEDGGDTSNSDSSIYTNISSLVKNGTVKVIVTTNFDHLLENSLRNSGISPVVVSTEAQAMNLLPLHTYDCLIFHINGDYLYPDSMKNTEEELREYSTHMNDLLGKILSNYGLIIVGWSANWDRGLTDKIASQHVVKFFTPYWIDISPLRGMALNLADNLGIRFLQMSATDFFSRLASNIEGLKNLQPNDPYEAPLVISRSKLAFSRQERPFAIHDLMRGSFEKLRSASAMNPNSFQLSDEDFAIRSAQLWNELELPVSYIVAAAYWGNSDTDNWWLPDISKFSMHPQGGGLQNQLVLQQLAGLVMFYAAGVTLVASNRDDVLYRLFTDLQFQDFSGNFVPVVSNLIPAKVMHSQFASNEIFLWLEPLISGYLGLGRMRFSDSWQRFEYLCCLYGTIENIKRDRQLENLIQLRLAYQTGLASNPPLPLNHASMEAYLVTVRNYSGYSQWHYPHIFLEGGRNFSTAQVSKILENELRAQAFSHTYFIHKLFERSLEEVFSAIDILNVAIGNAGMQISNSFLQNAGNSSHPGIPSAFWADGSGVDRP